MKKPKAKPKDFSGLHAKAKQQLSNLKNPIVQLSAEKTAHDTTDNKMAEDALRQSEERFRTLSAATSEGIIIAENDIVIETNEQFAQMFGYELTEVVGVSVMKFLAPEERPRVEQVFQSGTECTGQYRCLRKDGSAFFIEAHGRTVERTGRRVRITAILDITDRMQAEKNIEQARAAAERQAAELNAMFDTLAEPAILYDCSGKAIKANAAAIATFGFDPTKLSAEEYSKLPEKLNIRHTDGKPIPTSELPSRKALRGQTVRNEEIVFTNVKGRDFVVENSSMPLISDGKIVGAVATWHDITDRKQAEEVVKDVAQFRQAVLDSLPAHIAVLDDHGTVICVNSSWLRFARENGAANTDTVTVGANYLAVCRRAANEGDSLAAEALAGIEAVLAGREQEFSIEYPCHAPNKQRWFLMVVIHAIPTGGSVIITHVDITDRKQMQEALWQSKEQLRLFVEYAPAAIAMFDTQMRYVAASNRWRADYNLTGQQIEDRSHYEIFPEIPLRWKQIHRRCLAGAVERAEEDRFDRADGTTQWLRWEIHPWYSAPDAIGGIIMFTEDITDRKHAEETLRESEQRFRALVETTSDWVWEIDQNGFYTYSSPKVKDLLGYEPEEIIGKTPFDLMPPDEAQQVGQLFMDILKSHKPIVGLENTNLHKNGRRVILETSGVPIIDAEKNFFGYRGIDRDITERKQVEDTLRQSEERFRTLAEAIPAIVWTAEPDGTTDYYNQRWYEYSGLPQDATEAEWEQIFHPDDRQATMEVWTTAVRDEKPYNIEHRLRRSDGQYRWHLSRGLPLRNSDGRVIKWFGMAMDIDDQKRTLKELERLKDELENKNEELASIIGIASHDLRSPLVNIKGFSGELTKDCNSIKEILAVTGLPDEVRKKLQMFLDKHVPEAIGFIQSSADAMNQMLIGLMQVARAGMMPVKLQDLDMNDIFAKIAANLQFKLKETGIELSVEPLPGCRADVDMVTQIFSNLIENAIKYRDTARPGHIHVYPSAEQNRVTYCVEDNGKGIDPEYHSKIFEVFCRLSPEAGKGEGLGLTIAKRMVARQGGKIWVDSELGKGSKFFVSLPR